MARPSATTHDRRGTAAPPGYRDLPELSWRFLPRLEDVDLTRSTEQPRGRSGTLRRSRTQLSRQGLGMAIRGEVLVSLSREEVKPMAAPEPKPSDDRDDQPVERRPLVGKLDLKALHQPQGPDSGINAIIGKWPFEEGEDE